MIKSAVSAENSENDLDEEMGVGQKLTVMKRILLSKLSDVEIVTAVVVKVHVLCAVMLIVDVHVAVDVVGVERAAVHVAM